VNATAVAVLPFIFYDRSEAFVERQVGEKRKSTPVDTRML
jgi:hypothetical protein